MATMKTASDARSMRWESKFRSVSLFDTFQDGTLDRHCVVGPSADEEASIWQEEFLRCFRPGQEKNQPVAGSNLEHMGRIARLDKRDDARGDELGLFLVEHLQRIKDRDPASVPIL